MKTAASSRVLAVALVSLLGAATSRAHAQPGATDRTRYVNPVLPADFSDPDVIRDGRDFWMTASSFGHVPGLPILHSRDLVHWTLVTHAIPRFADAAFDLPQHGNGVWAPSIRQHAGWFWIFYGDPDRGIYMTRARTPRGPWTPPHLVQAGKGLIDPTPLWDDDGRAWLVHAYARSRSGIKHRLVVRSMRPDGTALLDSGRIVFEDSVHHPTAEGPKFYRRDGWYWIFAPAGGVATGWQLAMRARAPQGPYEARTVLSQGTTPVNGPHQGAWVSLESGEDWFLHFHDRAAYGRIVHLQPMRWTPDGWPVIGAAAPGDTTGTPVASAPRPRVRAATAGPGLQTSDEFTRGRPGLQWQWQANPQPAWLAPSRGALRLAAVPLAAPARNLWDAPNLLLQKLPAESFEAVVDLTAEGSSVGDRVGLVVFGLDYAWIGLRREPTGWALVSARLSNVERGGPEVVDVLQALPGDRPTVRLRLRITPGARGQFAVSLAGAPFSDAGAPFTARQGRWVGAKFGLMAIAAAPSSVPSTHAIVDYVRVTTTP